jgi:hypothetical protein
MKTKVLVSSLWVLILFGCLSLLISCTPQKATLDGAKALWEVIGPEYTSYIEKDSALGADSKLTRIRSARLMSELLNPPAEKETK